MRCFAVETNAVIHGLWPCDLHQGLYSAKITDLLSSCMCPQHNPPLIELEGVFSAFFSHQCFYAFSSREASFHASSKVHVMILHEVSTYVTKCAWLWVRMWSVHAFLILFFLSLSFSSLSPPPLLSWLWLLICSHASSIAVSQFQYLNGTNRACLGK